MGRTLCLAIGGVCGPSIGTPNLVAMMPQPTLSVVVPVYNSVESLPILVERLEQTLGKAMRLPYEVILVDDGSPNPETWPCLEVLAGRHSQVRAFQLIRNFGRQGAVLCGFNEARGRWIVVMDDDLQHRPEDIPLLYEKREHDIVMGAFLRKHHSLYKRMASRIKGYLDYKLAGKPRHIVAGPFMLIRAEVIEAALKIRSPYPFVAAILYFVTRDVVNVEVSHDSRKFGASQFTVKKMVQSFAVLLLHNTSALVNLVALVGISVAGLSFVYGSYIVINALWSGTDVPGWASLMGATSFMGGTMLLSLAVIAEYLVRILNGVENRPPFILRKRIESDE